MYISQECSVGKSRKGNPVLMDQWCMRIIIRWRGMLQRVNYQQITYITRNLSLTFLESIKCSWPVIYFTSVTLPYQWNAGKLNFLNYTRASKFYHTDCYFFFSEPFTTRICAFILKFCLDLAHAFALSGRKNIRALPLRCLNLFMWTIF